MGSEHPTQPHTEAFVRRHTGALVVGIGRTTPHRPSKNNSIRKACWGHSNPLPYSLLQHSSTELPNLAQSPQTDCYSFIFTNVNTK